MFCAKCGNELAEGSAFCNRCGNPVNQSPAPAADSTASVGATSSSASVGVAAARKKTILPIALAVIIIAIVGVAIFTGGFGLLDDSRSNESIEESNTDTEVDSGEEAGDTGLDAISVGAKATVDDYTWEELSAISAEIATASDEDEAIEIAKKYNLVNEDGTLDGTQTKSVTLTDGTVTSVQIAGFIHDDKSDGSGKAGITFIFADTIALRSMNSDESNVGGWESSEMRSWLASDGKTLLPEELQDVIVAVDKSTNNVGYVEETNDISSVVTTTSDELWLFSYVELAGELDESDSSYYAFYNAEGSQYKLFSDCGVSIYSSSSYILAKTYQGESYHWWGRSPGPGGSNSFLFVYSDGGPGHAYFADLSYAVVPGFCI